MSAVDRPWVGTFGANKVYMVAKEQGTAGVNVSVDGGQTFTYTNLPQTSAGETGSMAIDPVDGTVYVVGEGYAPFDATIQRNPVNAIKVSMSQDGAAFSYRTAVSSTQFDLGGSPFPSIAVDAAHNIYMAWCGNSAGTWDLYLAVSRDRGQTWSAPVRISQGLTVSTYPTLAAGDAGHIAVAWYGTPDPATARNDAHGANWYVYAAMSTNGADTQPVFQTTKISDQPSHHGSICAHQILCDGRVVNSAADFPPGYEQGIADFFRIAVDPAGALNVVWHDTTQTQGVDHFSRQTGGPLTKANAQQ
jgi:hypothetical protein